MSNSRWDAAGEKLLEETSNGTIRWRKDPEIRRLRSRDWEIIGSIYVTEVQQKRIAIYEYLYENCNNRGEAFMDRDVMIEFIDGDGLPEYIWPTPRNRFSLIEAIREQETDVDRFLDDFLSNQPATSKISEMI